MRPCFYRMHFRERSISFPQRFVRATWNSYISEVEESGERAYMSLVRNLWWKKSRKNLLEGNAGEIAGEFIRRNENRVLETYALRRNRFFMTREKGYERGKMIMVINSTRFYFNRWSLTFSTLSVPIRPCLSPVPLVIEETRSTFRYGAIMPPLGTLWSNYCGTN